MHRLNRLKIRSIRVYIINPIDGTVLTRYAKQDEITSNGKALYKIADLTEMTLRAYVNGDQLGQIKLDKR